MKKQRFKWNTARGGEVNPATAEIQNRHAGATIRGITIVSATIDAISRAIY